jgi:8-oxo-dGTP pyrophosphatase MutT (NUDIX family)
MSMERFKPGVTVAAIIESGGRYLLVEEMTPEGLRLNNPAGHLEQGETPLEAVKREALEETACHFEPQALLGVYLSRFVRPGRQGVPPDDVTYLRLAYAGTCGPAEPGRALDAPVQRAVWLTPQEIRKSRVPHRSPLLLRCIEDHLAGRRFPLDAVFADPSLLHPESKLPD